MLAGFFSNKGVKTGDVIIGQYLGMTALVAAALAFSLMVLAIPERYIGFLGIVPILVGVKQLRTTWPERPAPPDSKIGAATLSVALVTIANGGDNVAVYVPLFTGRGLAETLSICATFAAMLAAWCFAARWLLTHPRMARTVGDWGHRVMPFMLMALGVSILLRSGLIEL